MIKWNILFTRGFDLNLSYFRYIKKHDVRIIEKSANIHQNDKPEVTVNNPLKGKI